MSPVSSIPSARPSITVDLDALCANYRTLAGAAPGAETAAAVKCDAYGLGADEVVRALAEREGCRTFFVAYSHEGASLRRALAGLAPDAAIYVFNGPAADTLDIFVAQRLHPVLNSLAQAKLWAARGSRAPAALHIDTGMNRLGAAASELADIAALDLNLDLVMSHLVCASEADHKMNARQRLLFEKAAAMFPGVRRDLAASGALLLGAAYGYEMIRPGVALYGVSPSDIPDPRIRPVATLTAPVIQLRRVEAGETVGYGATCRLEKDSLLATVALGYGDGFPRSGSNRASAFLGGARCPLAGRVSMDLIVLDVSEAPQTLEIGDRAEFFGPNLPIEEAAAACGTIGYELLTSLGARLHRRYLSSRSGAGDGAGAEKSAGGSAA